MHAGFVHCIADAQHFGTFFFRWLCPFAVEVHADEIGAQMPTPRSVGVAIGDDMQAAFFEQFAGMRIAVVSQHVERTFHPPLRLGFAGVLAGVEPDLHVAATHFEAVDRLAFEAVAEATVTDALTFGGIRDEVVVALHRVRREIGEPDDIAGGCVANCQRATVFRLVVSRISAAPIIAVFRHAGSVIGPAAGIGAGFEAGDAQSDVLARSAGDAEVEPLREFRILVLANGKVGFVAVNGIDDDIAAVERSVDVGDGHKRSLRFTERG